MTDDALTLAQLNALEPDAAFTRFHHCCHCRRWARDMVQARPFASRDDLLAAADSLWQGSSESEILEAFGGHAKIGDLAALRGKYAAQAAAEQGQVQHSNEQTLLALRDLNQAYEDKFGFIFIVCASGKSAEQMLALLQARIDNSRPEELANGAREQGKITALRLQKLVSTV
jgi:2-oxo-4-hydroxy-4-carboxy-5-ureidoimidazoline decarboxylase